MEQRQLLVGVQCENDAVHDPKRSESRNLRATPVHECGGSARAGLSRCCGDVLEDRSLRLRPVRDDALGGAVQQLCQLPRRCSRSHRSLRDARTPEALNGERDDHAEPVTRATSQYAADPPCRSERHKAGAGVRSQSAEPRRCSPASTALTNRIPRLLDEPGELSFTCGREPCFEHGASQVLMLHVHGGSSERVIERVSNGLMSAAARADGTGASVPPAAGVGPAECRECYGRLGAPGPARRRTPRRRRVRALAGAPCWRRRVRCLHEAEDPPGRLVDPVVQVADAVRALGGQIGFVCGSDVARGDATLDVVHVHEQSHDSSSGCLGRRCSSAPERPWHRTAV